MKEGLTGIQNYRTPYRVSEIEVAKKLPSSQQVLKKCRFYYCHAAGFHSYKLIAVTKELLKC